ncbi:phytoene desaturase family protein [Microlunatus flavus]|uniref:Pyridine nucleotide-disulfide oxidoreductase domain-containing protein 2 n=1 Tax=Microlunatus flavus TaxID=1036181 RepID=A0A1H9CR46_9ACTN|nr:NAD(P)/FAD-dependent oxidoreductase [Microlunatus flavus]SEQ03591.1 Phytoene dehydrogenase-related protein [Microlunatus flavus]
MARTDPDVVVVGGGHNALVAATYLARTGRRVTLLEAREELGGAVAGARLFPGVDARVSRYSYLVALLPDPVVDDLGLDLELRSRRVASWTPTPSGDLLVERAEGPATRASFRALTGSDDAYEAWRSFYARVGDLAAVVAPTLTRPLPRAAELRAEVPTDVWHDLVERPVSEVLERTFADDTVRGVVLTDALIGTFARASDASLVQNRCFLYHLVGNGTGEWRVPVGGMGRVADELVRVARAAGADLRTGAVVTGLVPLPGGGAEVVLADGSRVSAPHVLLGCAPAEAARLLGTDDVGALEGSQLKVNLLLRRLPRLRSGADPATAFAGTLHLGQGYARLDEAYGQAAAGVLPDPLPAEVYCHTLTDPSILGASLREAGFQTLTLFGVHAPARLFRDDPDGMRDRARDAALRSLQAVLAEPLEDCLALDADGRPCVEVVTPVDLEHELRMPGGHIFHGDLAWPWLADDAVARTPAEAWGVATAHPGVLLCGSGAVRGGAVSGLGGHNAAMAVLAAAGS